MKTDLTQVSQQLGGAIPTGLQSQYNQVNTLHGSVW